jgi:peptidoglycan hydrolase CwlO-like protein
VKENFLLDYIRIMSSAYGLIDSSSLLKNDFKIDTSTTDKITDLDTEIAELKEQVTTLQNKVDQLIDLINILNNPTTP